MKRKVWKLVEPPGTNAKTKVAKLNAERKTIGILDFKETHCAMRSLSFDWQSQRFFWTASCHADP